MSLPTTDRPTGGPGAPAPAGPAARHFATDVGWRIVLVVAAAVLAALGAWTPLTTLVGVVAAVVVVERLVRHRGRGMLDAALVGIGAAVSVIGLLGLLLHYLPGGITRVSWSIGTAVVAVAALVLARRGRSDVPASPFRLPTGRALVPAVIWSTVTAAVLAAALVVSVRSFDDTHVAPLDMSTSSFAGGVATVTLTSGTDRGPFELDLVTVNGRTVLATDITVAAGVPTVVQVSIPSVVRSTVELVGPGSTDAVRRLVFDITGGTR